MQAQQKQYAKDFLLEIHNQSSDLYFGNTRVDGEDISAPYSFSLKQAEEIIGAILKTCQDYGVDKEDIYKMIDYDGLKAVVRNIVKIQYSKNYKKITI